MTMEFKLGDSVEWVSQSNGTTTRKAGIVVLDATEAARRLPGQPKLARHPTRAALALYPTHKIMFDGMTWPAGRVIVEVQAASDKGKPALYMPRLQNLKHTEQGGAAQ